MLYQALWAVTGIYGIYHEVSIFLQVWENHLNLNKDMLQSAVFYAIRAVPNEKVLSKEACSRYDSNMNILFQSTLKYNKQMHF